jgi:hypothetical protein
MKRLLANFALFAILGTFTLPLAFALLGPKSPEFQPPRGAVRLDRYGGFDLR